MNFNSIMASLSGLAPSTRRSPAAPFETGMDRDIGKVNKALLPLLAIAFGAATYRGWGSSALSAVLLWSIASLSVGATLGFLFGIPKSATAAGKPMPKPAAGKGEVALTANERDYAAGNGRANTNLEEVSDWLTKIVVGLTLVHWATIRADVLAISAKMAATFSETPTGADQSFAAALIIGFFTLGFLFGYLYTRMFLQGAFARSDQSMLSHFKEVVTAEGDLADAKADAEGAAAALPSPEQVKSAERVRRVVPEDNPQAVLGPLRDLAAEYERIRAVMPSSSARTRAMSQVVRRMTTLALAAAPYIGEFANSAASGERLVAVVILKLRFDTRHTEWLVRRLVDDPPFIGFHAAGALLGGVRLLGGADKAKLQALVRAAQDELKSKQLFDQNRDQLLEEILKD